MKLLRIFLFLSCVSIVSHAQETVNDATWEETIQFINSKKHYIKGVYYGDGPMMVKSHNISSIKLTESKLTVKFRTTKYGYRHSIRIDKNLDKVFLKVRGQNNDGFVIETNKAYKNHISDAGGKRTWYTKRLGFIIPDDSMRSRIRKAFEHLVYLTSQNKVSERKKTNEKF